MKRLGVKQKRGDSSRRAFTLAFALFAVALLAVVGLALLITAQYGSTDTRNAELKNGAFNAAEAGLDAALDALDTSLSAVPARSATLPNGYHYTVDVYPNFTGTQPVTRGNPRGSGDDVTIPVNSAIIKSTGTGPNGERPTTVEAVVTADITTQSYPNYAIVAGRHIQGDYLVVAGIRDISNANSASVHANSDISARIAGGVQGTATASGSVNTLPPRTTGTPEVELPTIRKFDHIVSNYQNQPKLFNGPSNVYIPANGTVASSYTCPALGAPSGCLLFVEGTFVSTDQQITFYGLWTVVIDGDLKQSGLASFTFFNKPSLLIVNGNADVEGGGIAGAYVEVKGNITFSGSAVFNGATMALGDVYFLSGASSGSFSFDPAAIPPPRTLAGLVKIVTYVEY